MKKRKKNSWNEQLQHLFETLHDSRAAIYEEVVPDIAGYYIFSSSFQSTNTILAVFPQLTQAEEAFHTVRMLNQHFQTGRRVEFIPEFETSKGYVPENETRKANVLFSLIHGNADIVVASVTALLSAIPHADVFRKNTIVIKEGEQALAFNTLLERLVELDYDDELEVTQPGEFARRGGIIDLFSPAHDFPLRLEFWGDELDSVRVFSPSTQCSVSKEPGEYFVIPRSGVIEGDEATDFYNVFEQQEHLFLNFYPEQQLEHIERFSSDEVLERLQAIHRHAADSRHCSCFYETAHFATEQDAVKKAACWPAIAHIAKMLPEEVEEGYRYLFQQVMTQQIQQWLDTDYHLVILGASEQALQAIREWLAEAGIADDDIVLDIAIFPGGIIIPERKLVCLTEKEIYFCGFKKSTAQYFDKEIAVKGRDEELTENYADLEEGDYAVHIVHGICIYRGIQEVESKGSVCEMLHLEFADGLTMYTPAWQAHLVSRYVGSGRAAPTLSKIGGKRWSKLKVEAVKSIKDLALDMIRMQAVRVSNQGISFPHDDNMQRAFEQACPFNETHDQLKASKEIKADMESDVPMDRLLCGDVGYGKTEVAMRAVFKAVNHGKQVAILVPTTILAQQHFYTFIERFAEYPVIIDMLSRFRSHREQREIVQKLKEGTVDVIIGTHRLVQSDVKFKDLGLIVVDEEQRFGVEHKERLKKLRTTVDVLTMTATPIPRTLYMAMTGVRNLSTIVTAPNQRLPVRTVVCQFDFDVIAAAINREVQRGGQVYYLHNRVKTIEQTCKALQELLPEARFAVTHGRMDEHELEHKMSEFIGGNIDVLVTTTIIESGLDIPNANTIIIERADRFGLAELYQLRGRVGRWNRQAYAYILLPKHDVISGDARKRIAAIRRYTQLGTGFKLALRDLEIRGTGNLLGKEQSGHINAVGFDLYCKMLRSTVNQFQGKAETVQREVDLFFDFVDFALTAGEKRIPAGLPAEYIPSEALRVDVYRRISAIQQHKELDEIVVELSDRFGPMPEIATTFIAIMKIKLYLAQAGFNSIKVDGSKVVIEGPKGVCRLNGRIPMLAASEAQDKLREVLTLAESLENAK